MEKNNLQDHCFSCSICGNEVILTKKSHGQLTCCGQPLSPGPAMIKKPDEAAQTDSTEPRFKNGKTPFLEKSAICPVCNWTTENTELKSKLYMAKTKDIDSHVSEYTWRDPDFADVYPPFYVLFYCERCGYTDFIGEFRSKDNRTFIQYNHFADMMFHYRQIRGSVMNRLITTIHIDEINFATSLSMHLLALHIQTLVHKSRTNHEKLARLYLRTAWLLRDATFLSTPEKMSAITSFLKKLKNQDENIPVNEHECMEQAISNYLTAIDIDSRFDDPVLLSNTIFFISDLLTITGQHDRAIAMITSLSKEDTDARRNISDEIMKTVIHEEIDQQDLEKIKTLKRKVVRLNTAMEKIRDKILDIRYHKLDSMRTQIKDILSKKPLPLKDELVKKLYKLGLSDKDINVIGFKELQKDNKTTRRWEFWDPFKEKNR